MKTLKIIFGLLLVVNLATAKEKLLFYCGITMVKPMKKIAKIIETYNKK